MLDLEKVNRFRALKAEEINFQFKMSAKTFSKVTLCCLSRISRDQRKFKFKETRKLKNYYFVKFDFVIAKNSTV